MDDYQKAAARSWSLDHAITYHKGKRKPLAQVVDDAKMLTSFLLDKPVAEVVKLAKNSEADNG